VQAGDECLPFAAGITAAWLCWHVHQVVAMKVALCDWGGRSNLQKHVGFGGWGVFLAERQSTGRVY
jgi:hypothetical protein